MSEQKSHGGLISAAMRNPPPSHIEKGSNLQFVKLPWRNALPLHPPAQIGYQPNLTPDDSNLAAKAEHRSSPCEVPTDRPAEAASLQTQDQNDKP